MQDLDRFLNAQHGTFQTALAEIAAGRKQSHWMWFIFPQAAGLGYSDAAKFYAIANLEEAAAYLADMVLGGRLVQISKLILQHQDKTAHQIFGSPDDMKLHSSMTLFSKVTGADPVFADVIDKFFCGIPDAKTLSILSE